MAENPDIKHSGKRVPQTPDWHVIVRSIAAHILIFAVGAVYCLLLPLIFAPRPIVRRIIKSFLHLQFTILRTVCGLEYQIIGLQNLPVRPCIIACKHQSAWETLALQVILENPAFILKRQLLLVPLTGWVMYRLGHIGIERRSNLAAVRTLTTQVKGVLDSGRHVIVFPEGTRRDPDDPPDYRAGLDVLYLKLDTEIVPCALNSGVFWARRSLWRYPGKITLEFLPAIAPGMERQKFHQTVQDQIESKSQRLVTLARAGDGH